MDWGSNVSAFLPTSEACTYFLTAAVLLCVQRHLTVVLLFIPLLLMRPGFFARAYTHLYNSEGIPAELLPPFVHRVACLFLVEL